MRKGIQRDVTRDPKKYDFELKGDDLAQVLNDKVDSFREYAIQRGHLAAWRKNQRFYENDYFGEGQASDILDSGAVGELKALAFNHFRNILRHIINNTTSNFPAFDVTAINTNIDVRRAARLGKDLIEYYFKVKRSHKYARRAVEKAVVYGDGYLVCEWNPSIGRELGVDEKGRLRKEGDFEFEALSPYDVFFDYTSRDKNNWQWVTFRRKKNKYDLAKVFPKKKDELIALDYFDTDELYNRKEEYFEQTSDSPEVWLYATYHKRSNVLPEGKYILWCGGNDGAFVLYEGPNIYQDQLPVFPISPGEYLETSFGFTEANLLRGPQEVINSTISSLVTNATAAGANNIWAPAGSNFNIQELVDGMNLLTSDSPPEVLSFYKDLPGLKDLMGMANAAMETLSGQNAVVRGNVQSAPNLKSGVALMTVINMAQAYNSALQENYFELFEDVASFLLKTLRKVANEERLIEVAGKQMANTVSSFIGDDLEGVQRVKVERTNPIANSPAGAIEIGDKMLQGGHINPTQFFDIVNTGSLESVMSADEKMMDFIADAKETLLRGEEIPPIPGINHQVYVKEVHSLLLDLDILQKPENQPILQNILKTIQQQLDLMRQGDEIANLNWGGQPPTPQAIGDAEVNPQGNPDLGSGPQAGAPGPEGAPEVLSMQRQAPGTPQAGPVAPMPPGVG